MTKLPEPVKAPSNNGNGNGTPRTMVEAGGKIATDTVRGLSSNPLLLGVIVLNVIGIGAGAWMAVVLFHAIERATNAQREMFVTLLAEERREAREILRTCVPGVIKRDDP